MKKILYEETMDGLVIERIRRDHDFSMPTKHFHNEYEIYYLVQGERYYFINNDTYLCTSGCLVLIEHNLVHKTSTSTDPYHDRILVELREELLESLMVQLGTTVQEFFHTYTGIYQLNKATQDRMEKLFKNIATEIHNKSNHYELLVKMKLMELFIFIQRYQKNVPSSQNQITHRNEKHELVDRIAKYITTHYKLNESLDDIAKKFYVNKCYLSRIFSEVTGFTISEYININRIKEAKQLLSTTEFTLTEIALQLGFRSTAYFVRVFKIYTETTPHQYRKQLQSYKEQRRRQKKEG